MCSMSIAANLPITFSSLPTEQLLQLLDTHALPLLLMAALGLLLVVVFTFHSAAPLRPAPMPAARDVAPTAEGPSILLVDDCAVARSELLALFESCGYAAVAVSDGVQALEALSREFFAVMITDLDMPNMNGLELIAAVQGSIDTDDLPVIAITGHDAMHARVQDLAGLGGIFRKPWDNRDLLRRVASLATLRKRPGAWPEPAARPGLPAESGVATQS